MAEKKKAFPKFKGKPLVRCGDLLYYGDMRENYVVRMQVRSKKKVTAEADGKELTVADKVFIQLMNTDPAVSPQKAIEKTDEQAGLFAAIDTADGWLQQALRNAK